MWTYFFYGTLMDPEVAREILGRPLTGFNPRKGTLAGYRKLYVTGATYPGLQASSDADANAAGIVVERITALEVSRLSRYEGREYRTETLPIHLEDGETVETKLFLTGNGIRLTNKPWDFGRWQRTDKKRFLRALMRKEVV